MKKRVLVIGSGAREHAIAWKFKQSPQVGQVFVCPGNDGMEGFERIAHSLDPDEFAFLANKVKDLKIDLVFVGPDNALADGIVDFLEIRGLRVFGPKQMAAQIESSKAFSKKLMIEAGVATADFFVARSLQEVQVQCKNKNWTRAVVKADGLALGKGVRVCASESEIISAAKELLTLNGTLVVEEVIEGEEVSWLAICDGKNAALFPPARDYKRIGTGNQGPNTGGMGAFAPVAEFLDPRFYARVQSEIFKPILKAMASRGCPFVGILYAGLMIQGHDPLTSKIRVIEFNSRFGDPEAQVLLPLFEGDLFDWTNRALAGTIADGVLPVESGSAVYVVGAAPGYPSSPKRGIKVLSIPLEGEGFSAALKGSSAVGWATDGGRVMGALGVAPSLTQARELAYQRIEQIKFEGMQFREDIAK